MMTQRFEVLVAPCECGTTYYARTPNGTVWVEAEREEMRDVDPTDAGVFAQEVERAS